MPTVRIQEKNYSESIMVLKLKDGGYCELKQKGTVFKISAIYDIIPDFRRFSQNIVLSHQSAW